MENIQFPENPEFPKAKFSEILEFGNGCKEAQILFQRNGNYVEIGKAVLKNGSYNEKYNSLILFIMEEK
jgi:hypothetical protein